MASKKLMITNTAIAAASPGDVLYDTLVPGLHVKVSLRTRAYYLYFRTKLGQERRPKLGDCSILATGRARDIAREMLAQVAEGKDPVEARLAAKGEPTVADLWERVRKERYDDKRAWSRDANAIWRLHLGPRIGSMRISAVGYTDIAGLHRSLEATPYQANRALSVVSVLLDMAERYGLRGLGTNPCRQIPGYRELKRRRFIKPAEIAKFGELLRERESRFPMQVAFIRVMMLTGARPTELLWAKPSQVERMGESGVLRIAQGKNGDARNVYLPPQAMAELDKLPPNRPTLLGNYPKRFFYTIRKAAGCEDVRLRDFRRTFAVMGLSHGQSAGAMGELLGHKSAQSTKIYTDLIEDAAIRVAGETADVLARMSAEPSPTR